MNTNTEINITVRTFKTKKGSEYSDIYMNGVKIMTKHKETKVQTFLEGTVLGIYGIVTDNKYLTKTPQWIVYRNCDTESLALGTRGGCYNERPSANIIKMVEQGKKLHLITDTHTHLACKKSKTHNYVFKITHELAK